MLEETEKKTSSHFDKLLVPVIKEQKINCLPLFTIILYKNPKTQ